MISTFSIFVVFTLAAVSCGVAANRVPAGAGINTGINAGNNLGDNAAGKYFILVGAYTWAQGKNACLLGGGKIAKIETSMQQIEARSLAIANQNNDNGNMWIGLIRDNSCLENWRWATDGDCMNRQGGDYTNWGPSLPNNDGYKEDCVDLWDKVNYDWNDDKCDWQMNVLCQRY